MNPQKTYLCIAAVALIFKNEAGENYRVAQGETAELSEAQYNDVSAYVTLIEPDQDTAQALAAVEVTAEVVAENSTPADATTEAPVEAAGAPAVSKPAKSSKA